MCQFDLRLFGFPHPCHQRQTRNFWVHNYSNIMTKLHYLLHNCYPSKGLVLFDWLSLNTTPHTSICLFLWELAREVFLHWCSAECGRSSVQVGSPYVGVMGSVPGWGAAGGCWEWGGSCPQGEHLLTLLSPPSPHLHAAGICPPLGNGAVTIAGCSPQRLDLIYLSCLQLTSMSTVSLSFISLKFCMR